MKLKILLFCFIAFTTQSGCKLIHSFCKKKPSQVSFPEYDSTSEMVFMIKPGQSKTSVIKFLTDANVLEAQKPVILNFCEACDSSIFTIPGYTYQKFHGQTEKSQGGATPPPGPGASGPWGPVYFSVNITIRSPEPVPRVITPLDSLGVLDLGFYQSVSKRPAGKAVRVGILDTGIDPALAKLFPLSQIQSCMNGGKNGWNFANSNKDCADDFTHGANILVKHGSPAAEFMIAQTPATIPIEILPVKILDNRGEADLFHVLCGLAYAEKAGVKFINASFGFYASDTVHVQLFKAYIETITDKGIVIVAAAGNADETADNLAKAKNKNIDPRNLDQHGFYPAAFSETNQNVITVTTISSTPATGNNTDLICPTQNYSPSKVQIGVQADHPSFYFKVPGNPNSGYRIGSSFAAPIITGLLAANYDTLFPQGIAPQINRNAVLETMAEKKMLLITSTLKNKLTNGYTAVNNSVGLPIPQ